MLETNSKFKLFLILALGFILLMKNISAEIIEYPDTNWPKDKCHTGKRQSPIDFPSNYPYINVENNHYKLLNATYKLFNGQKMFPINDEAHGINVTAFGNNGIDMGEVFIQIGKHIFRYYLSGVHLHILSEHTYDGKNYGAELHMVHKKDLDYVKKYDVNNTDDLVNNYLVVGTWFDNTATEKNPDFERFGISSGVPQNLDNLDLNKFSRPDQSYYTYSGSFTTPTPLPACDESKVWILNSNPVKISAAQLAGLKTWITQLYPNGKNRLVKPLYGRTLYKHTHEDKQGMNVTVYTDSRFLSAKFAGVISASFCALILVFLF